jgi:hypothetical protein
MLYAITTTAVAIAAGIVLLRPRVMHAPTWRATITPLASIIGSGFLVAGPILAHAAGNLAWVAMAGLCAVAYLFGAAIRRNIRFVEPMMDNGNAGNAIVGLERLSHFALAFAYFISVAYYLNLFASFFLRGVGVVDEQAVRVISSVTIVSIGAYGMWRGLKGLETIEEIAVGVKLSLFSGVIAAMALSGLIAFIGGGIDLSPLDHTTGWHEVQILLGLVILVQGFETSRFLGSGYDAGERIRTMKYAQWLSTAFYIVFIFLMTPFFTGKLPAQGGETAVIDILDPLGWYISPVIIAAALGSQLSAAVADMNGAGGLLNDSTGNRVSLAAGYAVTAVAAVAITWAANIFEIIVYASKAFVIYYGMQSVLAAMVAWRGGEAQDRRLAVLFAFATLVAAAVLAFGVPAEGGG